MADHSVVGIVVFREDGHILYSNEGFVSAVGAPDATAPASRNFWGILENLTLHEELGPLDPQSGFRISLNESAVLNGREIAEDIWLGEIAAEVAAPAQAAVLDDLTGVPTRQDFRRVVSELQASLDYTEQDLVIVAVDLDWFKRINDTLGHASGDALLQKFVARAQKILRKTDRLFRIGGDEFVIVLSQDKGADDAAAVTQRLIERAGRPFLISGAQVDISISAGVALSAGRKETPDDLLKKADIALFQSKSAGKARYTWFEQRMADEIATKRSLEVELRRAMVLGQLSVQFEPQIYFATGDVHTLRSKIVWRHPEHGTLEEKAFMNIAESVGLVTELSRWQFDASLPKINDLSGDVEISLPVRSTLFAESGFVEFIEQMARKHGCDLSRLCLEFSEATLLDNEAIAGDLMLQLSKLGARLSLGDFGSGLVALSYLRLLPFSEIKIDFSSAINWGGDASQSAMATKIAELGSALGIRVLAAAPDSKVIHTVLSQGAFSHIERIQVAAPVEADKVGEFLEYLRTRSEGGA